MLAKSLVSSSAMLYLMRAGAVLRLVYTGEMRLPIRCILFIYPVRGI